MAAELTGTILGGQLRLDRPIELPDNSRVRVAVEPVDDWQPRLRNGLKVWKQVCEQNPIHSGRKRFTRDELHERG